jgi:hypothetical protein
MVGYWDGWSGIEPSLREGYGDKLFRIRLPLRDYLATLIGSEGLRRIGGTGAHRPFIGPGLLAANDRSVLVVAP